MPSREVTSLTTADALTRVAVKLSFSRKLKDGKIIRSYISCASRPDAVRMGREISLIMKVDVDGDASEGLCFKCKANGTMEWENPPIG